MTAPLGAAPSAPLGAAQPSAQAVDADLRPWAPVLPRVVVDRPIEAEGHGMRAARERAYVVGAAGALGQVRGVGGRRGRGLRPCERAPGLSRPQHPPAV